MVYIYNDYSAYNIYVSGLCNDYKEIHVHAIFTHRHCDCGLSLAVTVSDNEACKICKLNKSRLHSIYIPIHT